MPKGVDNTIVSNCTTHVYGRMNAPATSDAIHDLMTAKGGGGDDIGKLSKGEFYYSTEGSLRPYCICPRTARRISALWKPPGSRSFAGRQAWGRQVAYGSQFETPRDRALSAA